MENKSSEKPTTVRLTERVITMLGELSIMDNNTVSAQLRAAVEHYIVSRREDPTFDDQVEAAKSRITGPWAIEQLELPNAVSVPIETDQP